MSEEAYGDGVRKGMPLSRARRYCPGAKVLLPDYSKYKKGLLAGWALASVVLFYDGEQPINIVNALVVLVLPQILLLAVWLAAAIPGSLTVLPGARATLGFLNPGRMAGRLAGIFSGNESRGLAMLWDPDRVARDAEGKKAPSIGLRVNVSVACGSSVGPKPKEQVRWQ